MRWNQPPPSGLAKSTAARGEESLTSKEMVLSAPSPVVARFEISGATVSIVKS